MPALAEVISLLAAVLPAAGSPSPYAAGFTRPSAAATGLGQIVFTQLAPGVKTATYEGARIVRLRADGSLEVLTADFHSAADPEVSFDGTRILFSAKRQAADRWQIFEMGADGSGARQITNEPGDCRKPIYQSLFYNIAFDRPWHQVTFVEYDPRGIPNIYSSKLDGTLLRRLTYVPGGAMDPYLAPDGRILFAAWQRGRLENGAADRLGLFGINLDGTDYAVYSAEEGGPRKRMPAVTATRLAVFVEPRNPGWDGEGTLAAVTLRRNLHSYRKLTFPAQGWFHSPSPLPKGGILVARRAGGTVTHGIWRFDPENKALTLVYDDPVRHDVQPKLLAARAEPDGRSSVVDDNEPTGRLYCLNVYVSDLAKREWTPPGTVKRVRLIEGIPPEMRTRFLGETNVEEDGSFYVQLPANTPFKVQTLDADGLALRTSDWIWVKNKEARGCIGCHEDGELTPENRLAAALTRPSVPLTLPEARRRTVEFEKDVRPILALKCGTQACHGGAAAPRMDDAKALARFINPGRARTSPLVWSLFGKNTSRPWDPPAPAVKIHRMPPEGSTPLTERERRTVIEWIDLGAQTAEAAVHVRQPSAGATASGGGQ